MSTPIVLTVENVTLALIAAVKEKGEDYVYVNANGEIAGQSDNTFGTMCNYVHNLGEPAECPGCIVGNTLNRLGVSLITLSGYERRGALSLLESLARAELVTYEDDSLVYILARAQTKQDNGGTWGAALEFALSWE